MRTPNRGAAAPTTAQLRNDIDTGRTGDKAAGVDPAAAPLGTDDEAAGTPPSPEVIAWARVQERQLDSAKANGSEPALTPDGRMKRAPAARLGLLVGALGALLLALVAAFLLR